LKKVYKILRQRTPKRLTANGWAYEDILVNVEVMCVVGIYAMVRVKRCIPFVCFVDKLE
jgi:hypothetical protein